MKEENFLIAGSYIWFTMIGIGLSTLLGMWSDDNVAFVVLSTMFVFLGTLFTLSIHKKDDRRNAVYLFLLFYCIYLLYTILVHYGLLTVYDMVNISPDERHFFTTSDDIYTKIQNGYSFFQIADIFEYKDTAAMVYYTGLVATLANLYGENSVLIQKLGVTFVAALVPMVMYGISRLYLSSKTSILIAIIYGLFSFVPYLSSVIMRDIHIALMFILSMYLIVQKFSILNIILLSLVVFVSYYLRPQTGIFMMGFVSIYLFFFIHTVVKSKFMERSIYIILLLLALGIILNSSLMDMFSQISESSAQRSSLEASSSSMGAKMAKLPFGLNIVALFGFSQIQPFPPSVIFSGSNRGFFELTYLIAAISWFFGWGFLLYGLFKKNIWNNQNLKVKLIFLFSIVYLILVAVVDFNQRRQMAVYPIIYLFMVFSYLSMSVSERTKVWISMGILYWVLVLLINYIKV